MFAGIGGFRSGLSHYGDFFVPVGYCEIDPYAKRAYEAIYEPKGEIYFEDARGIVPESLPDIDLICGGFPCQSFSIAGKRGGFEDARGTLFFEIARIARVAGLYALFKTTILPSLGTKIGEMFNYAG